MGRRSIRIYDLQRRALRVTKFVHPSSKSAEATFRWRLYRVFNQMAECGVAEQTPEQKARFLRLIDELDSYRREDTASFIDGVQASARAWLKSHPVARMAAGRSASETYRPRSRKKPASCGRGPASSGARSSTRPIAVSSRPACQTR